MGKEAYKDIWVFAEQEGGRLSSTTFELLAKSHDLKQKLGGEDAVVAVLLGSGVESLAAELFAYGAEKVILAEHEALALYSARPYEKALVQLCEKYKPPFSSSPPRSRAAMSRRASCAPCAQA